MRYGEVKRGRFLARPNRFVAHVELEGERVVCHVKNTGRCRELLTSGAAVYLERAENPARKTPYDLIAVEKGDLLINMDAQAPNKVFGEWAAAGRFLPGLTALRPEFTWEDSRFDFRLEDHLGPCFVEVKGVTLEQDGLALFPDVPGGGVLRGADEGAPAVPAQRRYPPRLRAGPPGGRGGGGGRVRLGLRRHAGEPDPGRAGGGGAVNRLCRHPSRALPPAPVEFPSAGAGVSADFSVG